ncbi:MAG: heme exporter protein CcmD [Myxococcota bacterium]
MVYVVAAYAIVLAPLVGYAIHLRGRRRTLLRDLETERD